MALKLVHSNPALERPDQILDRAQMACAREDWEGALVAYGHAIERWGPRIHDERLGDILICIAYCHLNLGRIELADEVAERSVLLFGSEEKRKLVTHAYREDRKRKSGRKTC